MSIEKMDPNENWGRKTVRMKFMQWDYSTELTAVVGGNTLGFSVIETALSSTYDDLPKGEYNEVQLILKRANGDELLCCDEEDRGDEWLGDMLVAAEIIKIEMESREAYFK